MQGESYLTTDEAADYLRLKERKLYELATGGRIPCSKATGKWLFPRAALDRWIAAGLARPEGFDATPAPAIVGGSTDPLLEWAIRQSGSGLASLPEGSAAGLERLARNEVAMAAVHFHRPAGDDEDANLAATRDRAGLHDAVVIAFARREQGLVVAAGNPLGLTSPADALRRQTRPVLRQEGAGAQLLLARLLAADGVDIAELPKAPRAATGQDLAMAIRAGTADWGMATRAVAATHGLGFVALAWERFDLVLRRRSYFEPGPQALFRFLATPDPARHAGSLGGYDLAEIGKVRLNL
ncbi:MAG: helix-turn-helix transcriptional regulator [Alphaproteobacteria bacterium]